MGRMTEIAGIIRNSDSVLIFAHTNMDGDALGSSAALCHVLRNEGKTAYILCEDEISDNLAFLDRGYCTWDLNTVDNPDVCICLDCHGEDRMPKRYSTFLKGKEKLCLDHHATFSCFEGISVIDPHAAATGELVYELIKEAGFEIDTETAEALFAAITTDTGNFQYSNTTKKTFEIVTELFDFDLRPNKVSVEIYENVSPNRIRLESAVMNAARFVSGGRAVIAPVTQEMLRCTEARMEDTDGIAASLRSIRGVEISALLKEKEDGSIKVSMRAKTSANVAAICEKHGGGGHIKAAGCTLSMSMDDAIALIETETDKALEE